MLPSPQTENMIVYGYVHSEERNVDRPTGPLSTIPVAVIQMVFEYYRNHDFFQWNDSKKMNEFLNTEYKKSFKTKSFQIEEIKNATFNFNIYPNGRNIIGINRISFNLQALFDQLLIDTIVVNVIMCSPEISQFYAKTIMIWRSGDYGMDDLMPLSKCRKKTGITFIGKMNILSIKVKNENAFKKYSNNFVKVKPLTINKRGIKLDKEIYCEFTKIYGVNNNTFYYSKMFGISNNWIFLINCQTKEVSIRLMQLPSEIMLIRICIRSKQLSPPRQRRRISYSNDTICLGKLGKGKDFEFPFYCSIELDAIYNWNWDECEEENWGKIGINE